MQPHVVGPQQTAAWCAAVPPATRVPRRRLTVCAGACARVHVCAGEFERCGASEAVLDESHTAPGRPNVYGVWRAAVANADAAPWVGIDVHTDTVAVEGYGPTFGAFDGMHHRDQRRRQAAVPPARVRACLHPPARPAARQMK